MFQFEQGKLWSRGDDSVSSREQLVIVSLEINPEDLGYDGFDTSVIAYITWKWKP